MNQSGQQRRSLCRGEYLAVPPPHRKGLHRHSICEIPSFCSTEPLWFTTTHTVASLLREEVEERRRRTCVGLRLQGTAVVELTSSSTKAGASPARTQAEAAATAASTTRCNPLSVCLRARKRGDWRTLIPLLSLRRPWTGTNECEDKEGASPLSFLFAPPPPLSFSCGPNCTSCQPDSRGGRAFEYSSRRQ